MPEQGLEKGLEAAADHAAEGVTLGLHVTDPGRSLDLVDGWGADEADLHPLSRWFLSHGPSVREGADRRNPWDYRSGA